MKFPVPAVQAVKSLVVQAVKSLDDSEGHGLALGLHVVEQVRGLAYRDFLK
jgi:hypothetical protein